MTTYYILISIWFYVIFLIDVYIIKSCPDAFRIYTESNAVMFPASSHSGVIIPWWFKEIGSTVDLLVVNSQSLTLVLSTKIKAL